MSSHTNGRVYCYKIKSYFVLYGQSPSHIVFTRVICIVLLISNIKYSVDL